MSTKNFFHTYDTQILLRKFDFNFVNFITIYTVEPQDAKLICSGWACVAWDKTYPINGVISSSPPKTANDSQ